MMNWIERFSIEGKRALVTGGSKGIGAEIAAVLADAGADVAIAAEMRRTGRNGSQGAINWTRVLGRSRPI